MNRLTILIEELCPEGVTHRALSDLFVQLNGMSGVKNKWAESGNCQFIDYLNVYKKMVVDVNDLPFATVTNFNQTTLKKGDVLFTAASETADECALAAEIEDDIQEGIFLDDHLFGLRAKVEGESFVKGYLKYAFRSSGFRTDVNKVVRGVTRHYISKTDFMNIKIPVPPLDIQREIVEILDKYTVMSSRLSLDLSAELEARKKQYDYYKQLLLKDNSRYTKAKLKDIVSIYMCRRIKKSETESKGEIPFYQNGTLGGEAKLFLNRDTYENYRKKSKMPLVGEVMLSTAGTIGKAIMYKGEEAYFQDSNIVWLHNDESKVSNKYLYWFCKSMPWVLPDRVTLRHLHNYMIEDTDISIPPKEDQENIIKQFQELYGAITEIEQRLEKEIELIEKQYKYYIDKMFDYCEAK